MELRIKLAHEWRTIEHVEKVVISPNDGGDIGGLDIEFHTGVGASPETSYILVKEGAVDGG